MAMPLWYGRDLLDAVPPGTVRPVTAGAMHDAPAPTCVRLFGRSFQTGSAAAVVAGVAALPADGPRMIVTANIDHIVRLDEDAAFGGAYDRAAARTLDGMPLVWLARLVNRKPVARITGHDLLACVADDPPPFAARVFLVAAQETVADAFAARMEAAGLPADAVVSVVPPMGFEDDAEYGLALAARIRAHGTTLLVMGVGAPKSEVWTDRQGVRLGSPVVFCVGDALAVAAGCMPRAPRLMQRLGLEWLFRFFLAPRRLFVRYFIRSWRILGIAARAHLFTRGGG